MRWKRYVSLTLSLLASAALILFILDRSAKTAEESVQESGWVWNVLRSIIPGISVKLVRKLAHFTEYFVLGGLLWTDFYLTKEILALPLLTGLIVAGADEYFQTFIPGRSGQLSDVLIDFSGLSLSALLLWQLRRSGAAARTRSLN